MAQLRARTRLRALVPTVVALLATGSWLAPTAFAAYVNFEAGQVRPLALAPDGSRLFAVNTPDNRLAIFDLTPTGMTLAAEIPVGLRPVAVAVRDAGGGVLEAWVVNHLSDSVSVVAVDDVDPSLSHVEKTLLVGDEPRDIVFGGSNGEYAFVTTARRGQHDTVPPPNFATPGIGRALVFVFDAADTGAGIGGTPVNVIELFSDAPRALAVSGDGQTVYAAAFKSGNGTTAIGEVSVTANGGVPAMPPGATPNWPETGLIVKHDPVTDRWEDEDGSRNWNSDVPFELPDLDVFLIDATASPPTLQPAPNGIPRVGTVLFNMAVRPGAGHGELYVSNLEMKNELRFSGFIGTINGLQSRFVENRISVVSGMTPTHVHLNSHVDYSVATGPPSEIDQSLGLPLDMTFDSTGTTLYLTAFGSSKVAVLDADDLEAGIVGTDRIDVGGGPSGVVLDEARDRLYVMTRFANEVVAIDQPADSANRSILATTPLATPEPPAVKNGRPFLYDTAGSSGHGDASCGTCHLFGDMDKLAWDLGDPFGAVTSNPNPMVPIVGGGIDFHPNKGPMTTQSLRGLPGQGPLHWRGDKTNFTDPLDVPTDFDEFNEAFVSLLGRASELDPADFQQLNDFVMTLVYPPTPVRALDNSLNTDQADGQNVFTTVQSAVIFTCNNCHLLPTGTDGSSLDEEAAGVGVQTFKIPHLRNMYEKVGAFSTGGDQISGFGLIHDGSTLSMGDFVGASVFTLNNNQENDLEAFLMAVDTGLAAMVGQQVTVDADNRNDAALVARLDLMEARAAAGDCTLIVKGVMAGEPRGAFYLTGNDQYWTDEAGAPLMSQLDLRNETQTPGQEMTFTCSPPGTGQRMGINRDEDLFLDASDNCPAVANDDQTDTNGNGIGDACELVPEPSVAVLLAAGLAGLAVLDRRRSSGQRITAPSSRARARRRSRA